MKRYKLKKNVKIILVIITILIVEVIYLNMYLNRIETIDKGDVINETRKK